MEGKMRKDIEFLFWNLKYYWKWTMVGYNSVDSLEVLHNLAMSLISIDK